MEIGKIQELKVVRETTAGLFLTDREQNEVLLPASHIGIGAKSGDSLKVFVYPDADAKLLATLRLPAAEINQFVCLRVNEVNSIGAFMAWGPEKDLFVPPSEQKFPMEQEQFYVVYVYLDEVSKRLVGSSRIEKFVSNEEMNLAGGQEIEVMVYEESPLGYSCIINGKHKGLIYHNDVYQDIFVGDELIAYVKTVREDKLVDVSLQKSGFKNVLSATELILSYLEEHNGFLHLHDKSSPEEIAALMSMSKATFKKSIGILYRQRKVLIKPDGVYLVKEENKAE